MKGQAVEMINAVAILLPRRKEQRLAFRDPQLLPLNVIGGRTKAAHIDRADPLPLTDGAPDRAGVAAGQHQIAGGSCHRAMQKGTLGARSWSEIEQGVMLSQASRQHLWIAIHHGLLIVKGQRLRHQSRINVSHQAAMQRRMGCWTGSRY